jgi:hypothetical protein
MRSGTVLRLFLEHSEQPWPDMDANFCILSF